MSLHMWRHACRGLACSRYDRFMERFISRVGYKTTLQDQEDSQSADPLKNFRGGMAERSQRSEKKQLTANRGFRDQHEGFNFRKSKDRTEQHHNKKGGTRLTKRVLTSQEKHADAKLASSVDDDDDVFGTFQSIGKGSKPIKSLKESRQNREHSESNDEERDRDSRDRQQFKIGRKNKHDRITKKDVDDRISKKDIDDRISKRDFDDDLLIPDKENWQAQTGLSKNWANKFGTLSSEGKDEHLFVEEDEDDDKYPHHFRLSADDRKHRPVWYARKMNKLEKQGMVVEALEKFETMIEKDRVLPSHFEFNTIIGILGRAGYTKKAFKLFNQMKKMGIRPMPHTYTALFNACSNSPWQSDGLQRARQLEELMQSKDLKPNFLTIIVMIKAFGVCGDMEHALKLMDDAMFRYKYKITADHLDALLCGCCLDKEVGLRYALLVWTMLKIRVKPETSSYLRLLKCLSVCGIGDEDLAQDLLPSASDLKLLKDEHNFLEDGNVKVQGYQHIDPNCGSEGFPNVDTTASVTIDSEHDSCTDNTYLDYQTNVVAGSQINKTETSDERKSDSFQPGSMETDLVKYETGLTTDSIYSQEGSVDNVHSLIKSWGEIVFVGGVRNFMADMLSNDVQPDVYVFSALLKIVGSQDKMTVLTMMEKMNVKLDTVILNVQMQSHCKGKYYEGAWEVLSKMKEYKLQPDMVTFLTLAGATVSQKRLMMFFTELEAANFAPTIAIMGRLFANSRMKFHLKMQLIWQMKKYDMKPDERMITGIERSIVDARAFLVQKEKGLLAKDSFIASDSFETSYLKFVKHYEDWLVRVELEKAPHPWQHFEKKSKKVW